MSVRAVSTCWPPARPTHAAAAKAHFHQRLASGLNRATADGPARFYLDKIEEFRTQPPPREWLGEIELKEK